MITLSLLGYIDPAATTALISSLTAVFVALGATFIILWRKFKKKVSKVLHKDENAGKIVEDDLVINDEQDQSTETEEQTAEEVDSHPAEENTEAAPAGSPADNEKGE